MHQLLGNEYLCGSDCTTAFIAIWPWCVGVALGRVHNAAQFLDAKACPILLRCSSENPRRCVVRAKFTATQFMRA